MRLTHESLWLQQQAVVTTVLISKLATKVMVSFLLRKTQGVWSRFCWASPNLFWGLWYSWIIFDEAVGPLYKMGHSRFWRGPLWCMLKYFPFPFRRFIVGLTLNLIRWKVMQSVFSVKWQMGLLSVWYYSTVLGWLVRSARLCSLSSELIHTVLNRLIMSTVCRLC